MPHSFGAYLILYIMVDLFNYTRRASSVAHIGAIDLGGDNPIRIQSMTTTNTNDTEACVRQAERLSRLVASWCASPLRVPARQRT